MSDFLEKLNINLKTLNKSLRVKDIKENWINLFIFGLPRSGTTLLSQIIFNAIDVGCTDNLMARFWDAPIVGANLSQEILRANTKGNPKDYQSFFGRTQDINAPHEFSNFWKSWLKVKNIFNYDPNLIKTSIDWIGLKKEIYNINQVFNKGLVFKTMEYTGYFPHQFLEMFKTSIFIYIEREPIEVAQSIYQARKKIYDNPNQWWASVPVEYEQIKNMTFEDQIPLQMKYLKDMYINALSVFGSKNSIVVKYEDLCKDPVETLKKIKSLNPNFELIQDFDNGFSGIELNKNVIDNKIRTKLEKGLEAFFY